MSRARHSEKKAYKGGGRVGLKAAGNPDVFKEAEGEEEYSRKRGGKVKKHGDMHAEGKHAKHRRDRMMHKGRKSGGRVGSDRSPLSSAHHGGKAGEEVKGEPD